VAADAPGVRSILENAAIAKQKGLAVVSGLCYRYHLGKREIVKRVHEGEIGDVISLHVSYNGGTSWLHARKPEWSEMEYQVRNWPYFNWLSGDFNVEQHVHSLDKAAWVLKDETPIRASGMGGRQVRTGEQFGNVYDHMAVVYEYAGGKKVFSNCRQMAGCSHEVSDYIYGSKGIAEMMSETITPHGGKKWKNREKSPNMWQQEQTELFASIRAGAPLFNADYMCKSTMLAIMGRMACYTGKTLTWDDCFNSQQKLGPEKLEWGDVPVDPVAMPGITPFA
jgi:myo-inositol 2-dehydrogenase/D-chiro-inositol 1-dehydrogenase